METTKFKENEVVYTQQDGQIVNIGLVESVSPFLKVLTPYRAHLHKPYYSTILEKEWKKSNIISSPEVWFTVTHDGDCSVIAEKYGIRLNEKPKTEEVDTSKWIFAKVKTPEKNGEYLCILEDDTMIATAFKNGEWVCDDVVWWTKKPNIPQDNEKQAAKMYVNACESLESKPLGSGIFSRNNEIFCIDKTFAQHISYLFTEIGFETICGSCSLNEYPDSTFFKISSVNAQ